MALYQQHLLILLVILTYSTTPSTAASQEATPLSCQPWTYYNVNRSRCECGSDLGGTVICDRSSKCSRNCFTMALRGCYCMTLDSELNFSLVGSCLYTCRGIYNNLQSLDLDNTTCGPLNRTGQMCGSCQEGYAPPVYSYSLACVECSDYKYNWLKYLAIAYFPLTVFYFIVIFFRVNVTAPPLNIYILLCQVIGIPPLLQLINQIKVTIHAIKLSDHITTALLKDSLLTFYGFWNLDFFRSVYPPFCLHPNMTTLQALALDYAIAVYPMCLIVITYILFKLHFHYSAVVWLCTPFRRCFSYFHKEWDLSNSLIGAFGTFSLLSYTKILYTSFSFLAPNTMYDVHGTIWKERYLFYDGTVKWFGSEHIPYGLLAIAMCLCFNILPLVLICLFPCSCTQVLMNRLRITSLRLNIYMEAYNGHYRYEPKNCRSFAGVYLALRIALLVIFGFVLNYMLVIVLGSILFTASAILLILVKPYKSNCFNIIDTILLTVLALGSVLYCFQEVAHFGHRYPAIRIITWLTSFLIILPPVLSTGLLVYRMMPRKVVLKFKAFAKLIRRYCKKANNEETIRMPYRFDHPEEYPLLLN